MRQNRTGVCGMVGLVICMSMTGVVLAQGRKAPVEKPRLDPNNAVWALKLSCVYLDKPLTLHMATSGGKVVRAFGLGEFNTAVHDVDASGLAPTENSLRGTVKVTINADQRVPRGGKPIECRFALDAVVRDGQTGGTYAGKCGNDDVLGMVLGPLRPAVNEVRGTINLELEQAVEGDSRFQLMGLTVPVVGGKVGAVRVLKAKNWSGEVKESKLVVSADAFTGDIAIEVTSRLMKAGTYTFTFDGKVVGDKVAGRFKSALGGKEIRASGMFSGDRK